MAVQARFYVASITRHANTDQSDVILRPVTRGGANSEWASATPSGKMELTITNAGATSWFNDRLGKEVAITFADRPEDELQ